MLLDLSEDLKRFKLTNSDIGRTVFINMQGKATMRPGRRDQCSGCGKWTTRNLQHYSKCCGVMPRGASFRQLGKVQQVSPEIWVFIDGYIEHSVYQPAVQRIRTVATLPRIGKSGP